MLKPLKDLLTYLQRNANSSNIFGLTTPTAASTTAAASTTMGPNEAPRMEETIIVSEELSVVEDGGDPLYDPLALDDCPGADVVNVSGTSVGSDADDDGGVGISPDQFTLVDVSTLKPKEQQEADEPETEDDDDEEPATVVVRTVVEEKVMAEEEEQEQGPIGGLLNGSTSAALVAELETSESSSIVEGDEVTPAGECERSSPTVLDKFASVEDVIRLSSLSSSSPSLLDEAETADGETIQLIDDYVDAVATVREGGSERTATVEAAVVAATAAEVVQTTAEQIQGTTNGEEEEEASDGSDSGLGLEPARSVAVNSSGSTSNSSSSSSSSSNNSPLQRPPPIKSSLKRRSEPPVDAGQRETEEGASSQKRPKKGITFEGVTVFYFPRIQGFGCVPSQGGCTLGMEFQHVHSRRLTLSEHSAEQRKVHRQQLQELNPRSSSSEDTSSEEEPSESGSEAESESYGFLQPVSTRQRRALLKAAGVRKIDPSEKDDCREIRTSREVCGCTCRGFCDPHRCACSLAGIKCQVDRPNFPCGCTHEGCANTAGRVEFNPGRVRTHFLHTIMKLRMEGAGEGKAVMEAAGGSSVAGGGGGVSDANAGGGVGGYVIGGEKNWSNGPVRLPPSSMVVGYGTDMPASTVPDMVDGTGSNHQVPGMLPQHLPMVLLDGMHHSAAGVLQQQQQQQHHLSHQSLPPYPNHLGADDGMHQNYPSATSDSLSLHYGSYRDYYGGIESGTIGDGIHPAGMPLHHHHHHLPASTSSSSSIEPSSSSTALHANMYYTDSYASFQAQADSSTAAAHIDPYRHNPLVVGPLHHHVPSSTTAAVSRQHMLTTGHDRPTASTSYVESLRPDGEPAPPTLSLPEKGLLPQVPLQAVNGNASQTPTASSTTLVPCSEQATLDQSFRSDSEHCDPNVTVISDATTLSTIDSSGDVVTLVIPDTSRTDTCEIVDDDDGDGDRPKGSNLNCPSSDFIDLETPQADNAERLEAINDLLASSRNTLSIVRPSIVAEEDDELRDFQHPPPEPSASAICYEEDDDVDDGGDDDDSDDVILRGGGGGGGLRVTRSAKDRDPPPRSFYGSGTLTNGTTISKSPDVQQLHQKRTRCPTIGEECSSSHKRILQNGSADEEVPFVSAYTADDVPAAAAVVSSSTANLLAAASVGSLSSAALEPSENLCEIIKNSIVETAVSH